MKNVANMTFFIQAPHVARLCNRTYASQVFAEVTYSMESPTGEVLYKPHVVNESQLQGALPVTMGSSMCFMRQKIEAAKQTAAAQAAALKLSMAQAAALEDEHVFKVVARYNECPYDLGGRFIVKGHEKVVSPQKTGAPDIFNIYPSRNARTLFEAQIMYMIYARYGTDNQVHVRMRDAFVILIMHPGQDAQIVDCLHDSKRHDRRLETHEHTAKSGANADHGHGTRRASSDSLGVAAARLGSHP